VSDCFVFPFQESFDGFLTHAVSTHQRMVPEFIDVSFLDEDFFIVFRDDVLDEFFFCIDLFWSIYIQSPVCELSRVPLVRKKFPVMLSESHIIFNCICLKFLDSGFLGKYFSWHFFNAKLLKRSQSHVSTNNDQLPIIVVCYDFSKVQHLWIILDRFYQFGKLFIFYQSWVHWQSRNLSCVAPEIFYFN